MRAMAFFRPILRRLAGGAGLLALVACLAAATSTVGAALMRRAQIERSAVPSTARYFVVVRSALADAARDALTALPSVRVIGDRTISDLLSTRGAAETLPDRLRVIEVGVDLQPTPADLAAPEEAMRGVDGVVDLIDLNATERATRTLERAYRWMAGGLVLVALGGLAFVLALARIAALSVDETREEIAVRIILGEDARRLWGPLGASLGGVASLAITGGALAVWLAAGWLPLRADSVGVGIGVAVWPLMLGGAALLVGSCAVAALSARRAVFRIARGALATVVALAAVAALLGGSTARASETLVGDQESLRRLARELAISRRALHQAERAVLASEYRVFRSAASEDAVTTRLAAAQLAVDAQQVARWRATRDGLIALRADLRDSKRAERSPGPPVFPRVAPLPGRLQVQVAFGVAAARPGRREFRHGAALRMRPGEVVRAAAGGRVAYAGDLAGAGPIVVLSHGRRTFTVYGRVAEVLVVRGMYVAPGEPIASAPADPGLLYFAVRERGQAVDPIRWLRASDGRMGESG